MLGMSKKKKKSAMWSIRRCHICHVPLSDCSGHKTIALRD